MKANDKKSVLEIAQRARMAGRELFSTIDSGGRNRALKTMARLVEANLERLLEANRLDLELAKQLLKEGTISESMISRLKLTPAKIKDIVQGINQVASLPDPLGIVTLSRELDSGLELKRITAPIGVLAVIFESRPDALPQIVSLSVKTANAVILKGGKEAENSNGVLCQTLKQAMKEEGLPEDAVSLVSSREDVATILKADGLVDLIIPRGSNKLVKYIQNNTHIPVLGHADGVCHIYIHDDADLDMAVNLTLDSKTQYPSACNAVETLLINRDLVQSFLPRVARALINDGVQLRVDQRAFDCLTREKIEGRLSKAKASDWGYEYSDLIIAIKIVDNLDQAIDHINRFGSGHTDCIVTANSDTFDQFFKRVDSAGVYWNASTRFADGFRYGFGAEVGIATGKLHPRGPVGLEGLTTYKYRLSGHGQVVKDYTGDDARQFSHKDLLDSNCLN